MSEKVLDEQTEAKLKELEKWENYFENGISDVKPNEIRIRGYDLMDLMGNYSYAEVVALTLKGELPSEGEAQVMNAILCSIVSHGFINDSEAAVRFAAGGNPDPVAAVAAGLLCVGFFQAGAPRYAGEFINEAYEEMVREGITKEEMAKRVVERMRAAKKRIPGLGHPYHTRDPRAPRLLEIAKKYNALGPKTELYLAIHAEFERATGKKITVNADGPMGTLMADFGYDPLCMGVILAISHMPGYLANAVEEIRHGRPFRFIPTLITKYVGPGPRDIPADRKKY